MGDAAGCVQCWEVLHTPHRRSCVSISNESHIVFAYRERTSFLHLMKQDALKSARHPLICGLGVSVLKYDIILMVIIIMMQSPGHGRKGVVGRVTATHKAVLGVS